MAHPNRVNSRRWRRNQHLLDVIHRVISPRRVCRRIVAIEPEWRGRPAAFQHPKIQIIHQSRCRRIQTADRSVRRIRPHDGRTERARSIPSHVVRIRGITSAQLAFHHRERRRRRLMSQNRIRSRLRIDQSPPVHVIRAGASNVIRRMNHQRFQRRTTHDFTTEFSGIKLLQKKCRARCVRRSHTRSTVA